MQSIEEVLAKVRETSDGKFEIICLNCLLVRARFKELKDFSERNHIEIPKRKTLTKLDYLNYISLTLYNAYENDDKIQEDFECPLEYIASKILEDDKLKTYLTRFDFISKYELIEVFADYCADFGIAVYDASKIKDKQVDLYLIKRKPLLKTEAVFIRTGAQMNEQEYKNTFYLINNASQYAVWTVFVTTPAGVYNVGFNRLCSDMEKLNTWLYIIDPIHHRILGVLKGRKSKDHNKELRDSFIEQLPRKPIRAPSQIVKISKYYFKESESYNPKLFTMYKLYSKEELKSESHAARKRITRKYKEDFRMIMIINRINGITFVSYEDSETEINKDLVSGFLSAMDSFIAELGGSGAMKDISYKGFYIQAAYGKHVKLALFLSAPAKPGLIDRLNYFVKYFEEHYEEEILHFEETGATNIIDKKQVTHLIREILSI